MRPRARADYAAFHAVSALHLANGIIFFKSRPIDSPFHQNFIRTGRLPVQYAKMILTRLFHDRQLGDDGLPTSITHRQASQAIEDAVQLIISHSQRTESMNPRIPQTKPAITDLNVYYATAVVVTG